MIDELSTKITNIIKKNSSPMDPEREEIINYGLNMLLYETFVIAVLILVSILIGVLSSAAILLVTNGILRLFAGGAHARTRLSCAGSYLFISALLIILSKALPSVGFYLSFFILTFELIILYIYAPGDTLEKPIASKRIRIQMKILSLVSDFTIFAVAFVIWHYNREMYNMIVLATLPAIFLLTPIGYRLFRCKQSPYTYGYRTCPDK